MKKYILMIILFFALTIKLNALENITIKNETLAPLFDKNIYVYNVFVSENTQIITINASKEEDEIVTGTGSKSLKKGLNVIEITSYKNGSEVTYKLNITRGEVVYNKETSHLNSITIEGVDLDFEKDKYYYEIDTDKDRLDINYELDNPLQTVKASGDIILNKEENYIKLEVTSEDKKSETTYIIKANKPKKIIHEKETKSNIFDNHKFTDDELEMIKYIIIGVTIVLIIILFYFVVLRKNKKKYYIRKKYFFKK